LKESRQENYFFEIIDASIEVQRPFTAHSDFSYKFYKRWGKTGFRKARTFLKGLSNNSWLLHKLLK